MGNAGLHLGRSDQLRGLAPPPRAGEIRPAPPRPAAGCNPLQTKQKQIVTGRLAGRKPARYEFSVSFDHITGEFVYVGISGGRPRTR